MKERRARLLQRRSAGLRVQHIDVLALLRERNLLGAAEQPAHRLVLRAGAAVLDGGEGARRGGEHALGVCGGLGFVEDVFGWGEGPYLVYVRREELGGEGETYLHDGAVGAAGHYYTLLFFECDPPYGVRWGCEFSY